MPAAKNVNVLVFQSGGCTPVMNASLSEVVEEVGRRGLGEVFGAVHGLDGVVRDRLLDLGRRRTRGFWKSVSATPGAVLGSGRRSLGDEDVPAALDTLEKHRIGYVFTIGGNDSADTARRLSDGAKHAGKEITVVHVPKTIDNDLPGTDHTPGYGSAARFVALATMGVGRDAEAMGPASPVAVIEVMGRDAGWLAAASILGKREEMDAPHFICLPEVTLDEDNFLERMEDAYRRWGFAVAVVAENATTVDGPVTGQQEPFYVDDFGHAYYEGPGRYLAQLAGRFLGVRARFEKPGTIQRSMMACVSRTDHREAQRVGRDAVAYAMEGRSDCMVSLVRDVGPGYRCETATVPLDVVAGKVRPMPPDYLDSRTGMVTREFVRYAAPLACRLPRYARLLGPGAESC